MRPIPLEDNVNYYAGAFTPRSYSIKREQQLRDTTVPTTANIGALGIVPVQGAYMDLSKAAYGQARYSNPYTPPLAAYPIPPTPYTYKDQVQNPYVIQGMPGYTSSVPMSLADRVSAQLNKPYSGQMQS